MMYYVEDKRRRFIILVTDEKLINMGRDFYKAIKITTDYWLETIWKIGDENRGENHTVDNLELIDYLNRKSINTVFSEKLDEL